MLYGGIGWHTEQESPHKAGFLGYFLSCGNLHLVGRVGFEPTTNWLKANCSTN